MDYKLLDSGNREKWEQFGPYSIIRPSLTAIWKKEKSWDASLHFTREKGWQSKGQNKIPDSWEMQMKGLTFRLRLTSFGHVGLFPEHAELWSWMEERLYPGAEVLNLFAYTGGASLACARKGAKVTHVDASQSSVAWAKENAFLNGLTSVRWIVEDASKFVKREVRRGKKYDAILLDPPTFGRGASKEVFKIEEHLAPLLQECTSLLSPQPLFLLLTNHTPGYTPLVFSQFMASHMRKGGAFDAGELLLQAQHHSIPAGCFVRWSP